MGPGGVSFKPHQGLGGRLGHHGGQEIALIQAGPVNLAGKGLGLLEAAALDLFPLIIDGAVEPQEMEAGGILPGEIFAEVQVQLPIQVLAGVVSHLHRQVEAVTVPLKGESLDEGQAFGADAGKFQGFLIPVAEIEPRTRGFTGQGAGHGEAFAFPAEAQGEILAGAGTHQLLGLGAGILGAVVALQLEAHRPQFEMGDGGEGQAFLIFLQLEAFQAPAGFGEHRPKQRGFHHHVFSRSARGRRGLGSRRTHHGLGRGRGRRLGRLDRLGLLGLLSLLGFRERADLGLLPDIHEDQKDHKTQSEGNHRPFFHG